MERICELSGELSSYRIWTITNLICYTKVVKNCCEGLGQVGPRMESSHLNNVKKKRNGNTLLLEMDRYGYQSLMVRGSPSIRCEVQRPIVILCKSQL